MKKEEIKERQGNLEVLRIFCILTIILYHYFIWGGINVDADIGNRIIGNIGMIMGKISSNAFILISGYFLFKLSFKIQKVLKLMLEFLFYSILVNIVMVIITKDMSLMKYMYQSIFPLFFELHWFVVAYIGMYLMLPFIKKALIDISKRSYFTILIVLGIILSIFPSIIGFGYDTISNNVFGNVIFFLYLAMIGGYISKFNITIFKKKIYDIILIIGIVLLFNSDDYYFGVNSIWTLTIAILIFDLFLKFNIKNNKIISFFAPASLGILLLHDNKFFNQMMWKKIFDTESYYYVTTGQFLIHIIICVSCIYLIGSVIDYARRTILENRISKRLDKNKILNQINDAFNE